RDLVRAASASFGRPYRVEPSRMRDIAVTLAVLGTLPFILWRPWYGILVWSWLGFMNPHRLAWGFATTLPLAMTVALTTMVALLLSKEKQKFVWTREMVLILIFLAWMVVTTSFSMYPWLAWDQLIKVTKIFLMIFVAAILINSAERLQALVLVIALSLGFYGVKGGIFTVATGGSFQVRGPPGTFIDGNNEIGLALAMTIPLLYYLARHTKQVFLRVGFLLAAGLTALSALGTQSRGALLGLGAMTVFLWLKSRSKFLTLVVIALVAAVVLPMMPETWWARMQTIQTYEQDASAVGRLNAWMMAANLAAHRITGGGFECFQEPTFWLYAPDPTNVHDSHSIYFQILGHQGYIGLVIFLLLIAFTWFSASSVIRATKKEKEKHWLRDLMAMIQVSLIAYLSAGAFLGLGYFDYFYNLVLIVAVAKVLVARNIVSTTTGESEAPAGQPELASASPRSTMAKARL
ncbi:MAG TPA: putative O-glycosylation ligase, exosortase A system-associated, partial [Casimicrobiaceae bacterium]|nr:putative O-glycosylation ligase, exosortase A system-associated [Casimicrobiaceae bacterium]